MRILKCAALVGLMLAVTGTAGAVTLTDLNSSATIDPSGSGMNNWTVDGVSQLYQQWFWYRIGSQGPEASLDTIGTPAIVQVDPAIATITYSNDLLTIKVIYALAGGTAGSQTSDIAETIRITNNSCDTQTIHFFQYADFDLGGTPGNDTVTLVNANLVSQMDPLSTLGETVETPTPNHYELAFFSTTRDKLNDALPTTLSDGATSVGPGDATWAFEWDRDIVAGGTFIISKDKHLSPVPEPLTMLGVLAGVSGLGGYLRRRQQEVA